MRHRFDGRLAAAAALLLLSACRTGYNYVDDCDRGYGCGGFQPEPSQGGIYRGVVAVDGEEDLLDVVGVVSEAGEGRFVDDFGRAYLMQVPYDRDFTTPITIADGDRRFSGDFDGTLEFNTFLDGTFITDEVGGEGFMDGDLELDNDRDAYEVPATQSGLAGVWALAGTTVTLSIDPDGSVFFQDDDACAYAGEIVPVEDRFAVVRVTLEGGCGTSRTLSGLAAVVDSGSTEAIFFGYSSGPDLKAYRLD